MENILYKNNSSGYFYLITSKGTEWNVCIEFKNRFNNKFIVDDELNKYDKLHLSENSIIKFFTETGINEIIDFNINDYGDFVFIHYKTKLIKINTWLDLFNFIATII